MWLFDHFPKEQIAKTYGFTVTSDFLRHLERAWKLLIVAPWGLDADARDRFVPASLIV